MKTLLCVLSSALLLAGCSEFRQADIKVEKRIGGENAKDAKFATFGAASLRLNAADPDDRLAMIIIASDHPDLCAEINQAGFEAFIDSLSGGDIPGDFVITFVDTFGTLTAGSTFIGREEDGLVIDPRFIVSNGAGVEVDALDREGEGRLDITAFDGLNLSGSLSVRLNQDKSGFFANSINVQMDGALELVPECDIMSEALLAGLQAQAN